MSPCRETSQVCAVARPDLTGHGVCGVRADIEHEHLRALRREPVRDGAADAAARPRDDGPFAGQFQHVSVLPLSAIR
jgi:hypothetical protein